MALPPSDSSLAAPVESNVSVSVNMSNIAVDNQVGASIPTDIVRAANDQMFFNLGLRHTISFLDRRISKTNLITSLKSLLNSRVKRRVKLKRARRANLTLQTKI